jgi:hypothetical protein
MAFNGPSRFLNDIDRRFFAIDKPRLSTSVSSGISKSPITNQQSPISSLWKSGDRVSHRVFGAGTVERVYRDEVTENDKIEIRFDQTGTKTLLLTHAKLERI